ncbi:MAG: fibronectin type III domain-containing protein [Desulfatiglandaceae bacterium]
MNRKLMILLLALFVFVWLAPTMVMAEPTLAWDASSGDVTGYRIYFGQTQGSHPNSKDVGNVTQYLLSRLMLEENKTYYFVARAYNGAGESGDSNEVSWLVPDMTAPLPPQGVTAQ